MAGEFLIVGHRGARGLYPENTIEGLNATLATGVRFFEIDVAVTADNVPVLTVSAPEMAERMLAVAEFAGALDRISVQSFDWRGPRHLGQVRPDIARAWLTEPKTVAAALTW